MPNGPRIRANNIYGIISDNPLTAAATAFTSPSLPLLPVVASAHAIVVLDPKRVYGDPEIVVVTIHTASSTVATVLRGQYGTSPREHPIGTAWAHVPIDEDFIEIVTSTTRPGDPYEGQFIFETDTNKFMGYGGVDWAPRDAGGQLGYIEIPNVVDLAAAAATETIIPAYSLSIVVGTGRRVKITAKGSVFANAASQGVRIRIKELTTTLMNYSINEVNATAESNYCFSAQITPSAGPHTYSVTFQRVAGSGTVTHRTNGDQIGFFLAEDIGAA